MTVDSGTRACAVSDEIMAGGSDSAFRGEAFITDVMVSFDEAHPKQEPNVSHQVRFAICLHRDPDDLGGWVTAQVIGLPGVASEGQTEREALENVKDAVRTAMADASPREFKTNGVFRIPAGGRVVYVAID